MPDKFYKGSSQEKSLSRSWTSSRAGDAQRRFVTRNAELLAMLAPRFEEQLRQENSDESFTERVRIAIQQKLTGRRPTIQEIADALHTSPRTLQRRLQEEGSSFERVLDQARHLLARDYLSNSVLELNEAAYLLGYKDGNSSFALAALGKEFRLRAGAKNTVQGRHRNLGPINLILKEQR